MNELFVWAVFVSSAISTVYFAVKLSKKDIEISVKSKVILLAIIYSFFIVGLSAGFLLEHLLEK